MKILSDPFRQFFLNLNFLTDKKKTKNELESLIDKLETYWNQDWKHYGIKQTDKKGGNLLMKNIIV